MRNFFFFHKRIFYFPIDIGRKKRKNVEKRKGKCGNPVMFSTMCIWERGTLYFFNNMK
ncbi:hypothetical protein BACPLE_00947 [Phocaeicola plebeius DSM 17135]|uniref:Uncharacterized protein n=1 Tax=Phocaeicola plebeius (strain DSM 17135 / JCM 12973 / CCUG 54634 / M2) TaxID=484018 RepID=B5CW58_PHOPM|nr:hypothetical protein BACPLE_03203 [Phocaeicola plebeius DSM 17135]EDY96504.1 hypothetical protein BACPLE_00947 [Phocaeicola plebeius DSM 17135]